MRVAKTSFFPVLLVVAGSLTVAPVAVAQSSAANPAKLGSPSAAATQSEPLPDPGTLFALAKRAGDTFRFLVVGSTQGGVWGKGTYTSDSVLAAAAVHAGMLEPGESGIVTVEVVPGLAAYEGIASHGVTSLPYGSWEFGYRFVGVEPVSGDVTLAYDGDMTKYRGQDGVVYRFEVTGDTSGSVWGDGVYTDDSPLPAAAVHAGAIKEGETGVVRVEIMAGQPSYAGADRNGIVSQSYGSWTGSYRVLPPLSSKASSKLGNQ